ncbi:uncharacterized protein C8Q71DRAFT_789068 [Rhodofomes roseus]|uniref:Secreted protein n=1 Tax=Rhodofomes roseus TaxID=34475 RepID=A0ABQ8JZT6_9APHY|nr:uncharacterized protein C8Q71DRAFT_789068 [Rhodofomes roseus]KAH9829899.1 hypothetical protein C8Q71DRAFT_789068 [Rhodofomes roseus]
MAALSFLSLFSIVLLTLTLCMRPQRTQVSLSIRPLAAAKTWRMRYSPRLNFRPRPARNACSQTPVLPRREMRSALCAPSSMS